MVLSPLSPPAKPNYAELVKFLVQPFLAPGDSLSLDCELVAQQSRIWIRMAVASEDKGRIFGRGGRNLQAIRAVLATAASLAGQTIFLDVYDSAPEVGDSSYSPRRRRVYSPYGSPGPDSGGPRRRSRPRYGDSPAF